MVAVRGGGGRHADHADPGAGAARRAVDAGLRHAATVETGLDAGARSTTDWWANTTRTTRAEAHRTARLAGSLEHHDTVRTALAAGDLRTDQAGVIVAAVEGLPDDVADWVPAAATEFLLEKATEHDAKALRILGRRLLEVIDPVAADAEEARRLAAEERHAKAIASFTMSDDGHGTCHGRFTIPSLHAAMLRKDLMARVQLAVGPARRVIAGSPATCWASRSWTTSSLAPTTRFRRPVGWPQRSW